MNWTYPERLTLGQYPTPLEPMPRLTRAIGGPELWIKRDDQAGLATGGNKTRKLEFVMAQALANGARHVITLGGPQSNHCRQTAAAAARLGLGCTLVLRGDPPAERHGNLLIDALLGAELVYAGAREREEVGAELRARKEAEGVPTALIPLGASTGLGALGYALAFEELAGQCADLGIAFDRIILASSSAGTQAGLVLGAALTDFKGRILGISIDAAKDVLESMVAKLARDAAGLLGGDIAIDEPNIAVNADYLGGGYAVVGDLERDAIRLVAQREGILLDPVYTGRAMGGLFDLVKRGEIGGFERVLFWHTGGAAALSAFSEEF